MLFEPLREAREAAGGEEESGMGLPGGRGELHVAYPEGLHLGGGRLILAAAGVELANQVEEARGGGLEVRRQLGDLVTQPIQLVDFHERVSLLLWRLYTRVFDPPWSLQDGRSRCAP